MRSSAYGRLIVVCCLLSVAFAKRHELTRNDRQDTPPIPTPPPPKEDGPVQPTPVGLLLLPFPQPGSNVQSLVDVPPGAVEAIQAGSSPYANVAGMQDTGVASAGPSSTGWSVPNGVPLVSQIVNQANQSIVTPGNIGAQLGLFTGSTGASVANDAAITTTKPPVPNLVQAVLGNAIGLSSNAEALAAFLNHKQTTTTTQPPPSTTSEGTEPEEGAEPAEGAEPTVEGQNVNDPLPNPVAGAFGSSQIIIANATQGVVEPWGNNLVSGIRPMRPNSDEGASSTETSPTTTTATTTTTTTTTTAAPTTSSTTSTAATTTTRATTTTVRPTLIPPILPIPLFGLVEAAPSTWGNLVNAAQGAVSQVGANIPGNDEVSSETDTVSNQESSADEPNTSTTSARPPGATLWPQPIVPVIFQQNLPGILQVIAGQTTTTASPTKSSRTVLEGSDTPSLRSTIPALNCAVCGPGQDVCTNSPLLRIIGGEPVSDDSKYPWLALITYLDSTTGHGSLVNDRVIVTTATIVDSMPTTMHIRANFRLLAYGATDDKRYSRTIATTIRHPNYSPNNMYENNIGLLILEDPLTSFVPVCLPPLAVFTPIPPEATMIGWGPIFTEGVANKNVLQEVSVKMSDVATCQATYPKFTTQNQCGGASKPIKQIIGSCTGDGGEPLVVQKTGFVELLAVAIDVPEVSCTEEYQPSVFTNVASFTDWIVANGHGCKCGPASEAPSQL